MDNAALIILGKKFFPFIIASLFGSIAHALEAVKKSGWKGWSSFVSDVLICSFVGYAFFHLAMMIRPDAAIVFTSLGSYWGTRGFRIIREWAINSIKANIK